MRGGENMNDKLKQSPVPTANMDFPNAIRRVIEGKKITKLEWDNENIYGVLKDGFLMIYRNGKFNQWVISEGDLMGADWVILETKTRGIAN